MEELTLGIDLGTSGVRCCVVDSAGKIVATSRQPGGKVEQPRPGWAQQQAEAWWVQLGHCLQQLPGDIRKQISHIAVDGTSSTLLLADAQGTPLTPALMYNDSRATMQARRLAKVAPATSGAHGASASLAKLLWLLENADTADATHALHQADWINGKLCGNWSVSDHNNALKLGYDAVEQRWPEWIDQLPGVRSLLPEVVAPGTPLGRVRQDIARRFGIRPDAMVLAGTTDSTAAFIATGATAIGEAVTSIGSTLVMKVISPTPIFAPEYGIYSHRLGNHWLAGGASNSGGAVLLKYFSTDEIVRLSREIDPETDSGLDFYPLPNPGERFPVSDPSLQPRIDPPEAHPPARFLHGLFEGIARIEQLAYQRLGELGAPRPTRVFTAGGGAQNPVWTRIRERIIGCPIEAAGNTEASCGTARLAENPV